MPLRTLAARRTDRQPHCDGAGRRAPAGAAGAARAGFVQLCRERPLAARCCRAAVRLRALAVPLERTSALSSRRASSSGIGRRSEPLPPEPGRLVVCALLGRARRERGCVTPGDDRLETRAYAVKRYLFRLGHAARSARYATSIEQLVVGLAPVMGWGPVPRERRGARAVRARAPRAACSAGWTTCRPPAWSRTSPSATATGCGGARRSCCSRAPERRASRAGRGARRRRAGGVRASARAGARLGRAPSLGGDPRPQRRARAARRARALARTRRAGRARGAPARRGRGADRRGGGVERL